MDIIHWNEENQIGKDEKIYTININFFCVFYIANQ